MFVVLGGSIKDVTEQCTFEWDKEPSPCKAYLEINDVSGEFTEGETIQGQTSGATATVFSSYVDGSRVYVENVTGSFQEGETIQGQSSGQTATVDNFVEERSYPDNITHGTFPDSIVSEEVDDYLEWESSLDGAGYIGRFIITPQEQGRYLFVPVIGLGEKIDSKVVTRYLMNALHQGGQLWLTTFGNIIGEIGALFNTLFCYKPCSSLLGDIRNFNNIMGNMLYSFYQSGKGTFRWRIHSIRVFKIIV